MMLLHITLLVRIFHFMTGQVSFTETQLSVFNVGETCAPTLLPTANRVGCECLLRLNFHYHFNFSCHDFTF
jgi:hypothetical protein